MDDFDNLPSLIIQYLVLEKIELGPRWSEPELEVFLRCFFLFYEYKKISGGAP
jgi:hypothetical protein